MSEESYTLVREDCEEGCGFTLEVNSLEESLTDDLWSVPRVHLVVHPDHVHLSGLYVPVEMRRRGIGRWLMRRSISYMASFLSAKSLPLMLDARPYGKDAPAREVLVKFYESMGFTRWHHHPTSMVLWPKEDAAV